MPAPFTIVTITDAEGDEFPVRVEAVAKNASDERRIRHAALNRLEEFRQAGDLIPTYPVRITGVERLPAATAKGA